MSAALVVLAVASVALALALRVWSWRLRRRYVAAIHEGARLDAEWVNYRDAGVQAILSGEWDEQAAWEAVGLGVEWTHYSSY